ncbi:hypothetical protein ILUMI_17005, partial [Ignelater luminosus]
TKQEIMERTKKLKGTNIWVEEDYTPRTMEERRKLVPFLNDARHRGERAILKYVIWSTQTGKRETA